MTSPAGVRQASASTWIVLRLTLLAICCGLLIGVVWDRSAAGIAANRADFAARQLREVAGVDDLPILPMGQDRYRLIGPSGVAGFIFPIGTHAGYNGRIALWLAVDPAGRILGVRVKEHRETPGLGDRMELRASTWILAFNGRSLHDDTVWAVQREGGTFDQFTGATITPRAIVGAVKAGLTQYEEDRARWLTEPP
jgi:RnfABCDGE-type electron transport complex G subunit